MKEMQRNINKSHNNKGNNNNYTPTGRKERKIKKERN